MKQTIKRWLSIGAALMACAFATPAFAQWQAAKVIATSNLSSLSTSPDGNCANFAPAKMLECVFWMQSSPGVTNIYTMDSYDGGATFTAPQQITSDTGQDYNPRISYDSYHQQFLLAYSKWHHNLGGDGNDVVFMRRSTYNGPWWAQDVVGDGVNNYWEASALALQNGHILVSYAVNGPESNQGTYSGYIATSLSTDNGLTWSAPRRTSSLCNAEFPRAIQNSNGTLMTVYSRYVYVTNTGGPGLPPGATACADFTNNGYPQSDIHQVWSNDEGATWSSDYTTYHNPNGSSSLHPAIDAETYTPTSPCTNCRWDLSFVSGNGVGGNVINQIYSDNQWASWSAPVQYPGTPTFSGNIDINPGVSLGCKGAVVSWSDNYPGQNLNEVRYQATPTCTGS